MAEVRLNKHMTHLEDLVLLGSSGLEELNNKLDGFLEYLDNKDGGINITTKIDGAPAVICYSHIDGYPDNSICLKSFLTSANNCLSSNEDIINKYGDRPDMAEKLKYCLELAKYIPSGEAWQGDCLFTQNDLKETEIDGTRYLTFQPNKIIYAFSEDNPSYEQIKNSKFGIAFHTIYSGNLKSGWSQSFNVDVTKLNVPKEYYIITPTLEVEKDKEKFKVEEIINKYKQIIELENKLTSTQAYDDLINNPEFIKYWNTFENYQLADLKSGEINISTFYKDLVEYIKDKKSEEISKKIQALKTDQGRQKAYNNYNKNLEELLALIETNKDTLNDLIKLLNLVIEIKMIMWSVFRQTAQPYKTFYNSKTKGYFPADMEGAAFSDSSGNIVKIVDRGAFSSYNRDPDILSGWQRESLTETLDEKTAVIAFGRLNPPTIGHQKLIDIIKSIPGDHKLYLSHTKDNDKNPLTYTEKLKWVRKAFGDIVQDSPAKTVIFALHELFEQGYNNIIYVGGGDRIGGEEDITNLIKKYNGVKVNNPDMYYKFDSIDFINAGDRDDNSDDLTSKASASLARKYVKNGDFEAFKEIVPFNEEDALELFTEIRSIYGL